MISKNIESNVTEQNTITFIDTYQSLIDKIKEILLVLKNSENQKVIKTQTRCKIYILPESTLFSSSDLSSDSLSESSSVVYNSIHLLGPKNQTKKIYKIHKDFELYQVFMYNFLCQNVPILSYYVLLMRTKSIIQ